MAETFQTRLRNLVDGKYDIGMRRSIQTVVLYEADRCLKSRYKSLRPFQRKIALYDCAVDLVNTLDFIPPYHKLEILFRTASGKVPLSPELTWRRMKLIDREITKIIIPGVKPFIAAGKSHEDVCEDYLQSQFEEVTGKKGDAHPESWEHAHIHIFLAYRMYYTGDKIADDLPAPVDPNPARVVPNKKPDAYPPAPRMPGGSVAAPAVSGYGSDELKAYASQIAAGPQGGGGKRKKGKLDDEARRAMLKEVKDHMDVLKDLEGIIPPAEMETRKKALWAAMPPTPGPFAGTGGGKKKKVAAAAAGSEKKKAKKGAAVSDEQEVEGTVNV